MKDNKKHRPKASMFKFVMGERCCSRCLSLKPSHSGTFEIFNNGLNQRWICYDCLPPPPPLSVA